MNCGTRKLDNAFSNPITRSLKSSFMVDHCKNRKKSKIFFQISKLLENQSYQRFLCQPCTGKSCKEINFNLLIAFLFNDANLFYVLQKMDTEALADTPATAMSFIVCYLGKKARILSWNQISRILSKQCLGCSPKGKKCGTDETSWISSELIKAQLLIPET